MAVNLQAIQPIDFPKTTDDIVAVFAGFLSYTSISSKNFNVQIFHVKNLSIETHKCMLKMQLN